MGNSKMDKRFDMIRQYNKMIEQQVGHAVRPLRINDQFHGDGFVNLLNKYGTPQDTTEQYHFQREADVPDDQLTAFYEGNGLFAKIIDTPAEEAVKHGFTIDGLNDPDTLDFFMEALDELDWEETAMIAGKWTRLFGGAIVVMLINDGKGIDEPLDWSNIQSIDDLRVYDRSVISPDTASMFSYESNDPFRTRGSRLGMPERYHVYSKYGTFTVHESRCLVFQNGCLPENCSNADYQLWGIPEYLRIQRAIRDAELAHGSAVKMLDRSVQAVYKMKDLAQLLATEEGESAVLRRLQTIDLARGLLSSIIIDNEGEDYDFRQFQFGGVNEVIDSTCNFLSALTSIPQTILFGRSPAGMNSTGESDMENFYNFVERIQKRTLRSNLRYLLSVIAQAGMYTGEIKEIPKIKVSFNPLWSMSDLEQADLDLKRAQIKQTMAQTTQVYVDMQAIDPSEVRSKLAESEDFDVENILDNMSDADAEDELFAGLEANEADNHFGGNSSDTAPAATKLPQDMTDEELAQIAKNKAEMDDNSEGTQTPIKDIKHDSVGVIVISNGKVLCGTRMNDNSPGTICGPGGHIEKGETPEEAAFRETEEEFGISPTELIPIGYGPTEPGSGLSPCIFLCTEYEGEPDCIDGEISSPKFLTLEELEMLEPSMFQPFKDGLDKIISALKSDNSSTFPLISEIPIDKSVKTSKIKISSIHAQNTDYGVKGMKWGERKTNCVECRNMLKSKLSSGELSKTLNEKKQSKHDASSERYKQEIAKGNHPSIVTVSKEKQRQLIDKYTEEGIAINMPNGSIRVYFEDDEEIGISNSLSGKSSTKTNCGFIHYSKDGTHIVPAIKETEDDQI